MTTKPSAAEIAMDQMERSLAGRYFYLKAKHGVGDKRVVEFSQMLDQFMKIKEAAARAADRAEQAPAQQEAQGEPWPYCYHCELYDRTLNSDEQSLFAFTPADADEHREAGYKVTPLYTAPPAREPSVAVSKLRELRDGWQNIAEGRGEGKATRYDIGIIRGLLKCADELKALCDRASDGRE